MVGIVLALASSVVWGTADFMGGIYTRRLTLAAVTIVSQVAGMTVLTVAVAAGGDLNGRAVAIGLVAGVFGALGISAFYRALATGTISIVSPVSACSALVPLGLALATGERPGGLALAGSAVALAGAVLASAQELHPDRPAGRSATLMALLAALGIGGFLWFLARASADGHTLSALFGARIGSLTLLCAGAAVSRSPVRLPLAALAGVGLIGVLDTAANGLFAVATQHGYISVVGVLGSEYPVVTVLLAQVVLRERVTQPQAVGIALALAGVGLVSAA
jgi:drug/metabolite transporter (DMT)-like permease